MKVYEMELQIQDIVKECVGCEKVNLETNKCTVYPKPAIWWRHGRICPMATHMKIEAKKTTEKVRVGQQKQKKK